MPTNLDLITRAYRMGNVIPQTHTPGPELGSEGLAYLNAMMGGWLSDRIDVGWFTQDDLSADAPVTDDAVLAVQANLAVILVGIAGMQPSQELKQIAASSYSTVLRTSVSDALTPANMDHLPTGSGKHGTGWSIETDS